MTTDHQPPAMIGLVLERIDQLLARDLAGDDQQITEKKFAGRRPLPRQPPLKFQHHFALGCSKIAAIDQDLAELAAAASLLGQRFFQLRRSHSLRGAQQFTQPLTLARR